MREGDGVGGVMWGKKLYTNAGRLYHVLLIYQIGMVREIIIYVLPMMSFETLLSIGHEYWKMVHIISWTKLISTITATVLSTTDCVV